MNRVAPLVTTASVRLERFDHPAGHAHCDPERESAGGHAVSLVEAGTFRARTTGRWRWVAAGDVFVTRPGLEFSCAHDDEHPTDRCLSVACGPDAVESLRAAGFVWPTTLVAGPTNRRAYLHHRLARCGAGDEARVEALAGALCWTLGPPSGPVAPLFPAHRLRWYADRVDRTLALIDAHYAEPLSLTVLARDAGMSVFHFARVFRELHGQPPHRYLTAVRLARADARLRAGAPVTETCFAVGFGSLSHFVTSYRRHFGRTPSATQSL